MQFERINPITNEMASSADAMTPAEASLVATRAAAAFPAWAAVGPNARRAILNKAASLCTPSPPVYNSHFGLLGEPTHMATQKPALQLKNSL